MKAKLYGRRGIEIPCDLNARLTNLKIRFLFGELNVVYYRNLNAYIDTMRQKVDLIAKIYPKIIYVKYHINIAFLENKDLYAIINYPCHYSSYVNLFSTLSVNYCKDLKSYIYGHDYSNIFDLHCSINSSEYLTQNVIPIKYIKLERGNSSTILNYRRKQKIISINTIMLYDSVINRDYKDLNTRITGDLITKDLFAFVRPFVNRHYESSIVKKSVPVIKLKKNMRDFKKHVKIAFNSHVKSYFYFSGNKKVYRENRNEHFIVYVEGYKPVKVGKGYEKTKVRKKYLFNLRNYNSIDEMTRDLIDRVTILRVMNLNATINSITDRVSTLKATIRVKRVYKSNRTINAWLKGGATYNFDLSSSIIPLKFKGELTLNGNIICIDYTSPTDGIIDFDFVDTYIPPESDKANLIFKLDEDNNGNN